MSDKPTSPFARLDTNLLRSTRPPATPAEAPPPTEDIPEVSSPAREPARPSASTLARLPARKQASKHASTLARQPAEDDDLITAVRRTVKTTGKEVGYVRMTNEEKEALADIVYTYKRRKQRTSDTEIMRIAINYALEDYRRHGEASMLARVIAVLLA